MDECFGLGEDAAGDFSDGNVLEGTLLDVADLSRQLIDSALPMTLLCSDACPGLCPACGLEKRDGACGCSVPVER